MIGIYYGGNSVSTSMVGLFGSIDIDATLEEKHDWKVEATANPVEEGAPITDHVIEHADKLSITGTITNSPLRGELAGQYFGGTTAEPRTQTTFDLLYTLIKAREPVVIYTKHAIYDNMVIQTISIPRNARIGEEIQFSMDAINIRVVGTQLVDVPPGISRKKSSKSDSATGKKADPQKQNGKVTNTDRAPQASSTIYKPFNAGVDFVKGALKK